MLCHFVSVTKTTQITEVQVLIYGSNVFILFLVEEEKMRLLHLINTFFEEARQVNSFTFLTFFSVEMAIFRSKMRRARNGQNIS